MFENLDIQCFHCDLHGFIEDHHVSFPWKNNKVSFHLDNPMLIFRGPIQIQSSCGVKWSIFWLKVTWVYLMKHKCNVISISTYPLTFWVSIILEQSQKAPTTNPLCNEQCPPLALCFLFRYLNPYHLLNFHMSNVDCHLINFDTATNDSIFPSKAETSAIEEGKVTRRAVKALEQRVPVRLWFLPM